MNDWDDRTLIVDTIKGVRRFEVDRYGRLSSINQAHLYKPGWNHATHSPFGEKHQVASLDCGQCGFYAYFKDRDSDYHSSNRVTGVIEGAGRVTAGDLGFRAERARIVALTVPPQDQWDRLAHYLFPPWGFLWWLVLVVGLGFAIAYDDEGYVGIPLSVVTAIATIVLAVITIIALIDGESSLLWEWSERESMRAMLRRNYQVPVYNTVGKMLRKHPTSKPFHAELSPEDPDFWK